VLLVGAGLYVRSLQRQLAVDPGFAPSGVTSARLTLPDRYAAPARLALVEELRGRLLAVPGVSAVAVGSDVPLAGSRSAAFIVDAESGRRLRYYRHAIAEGYLPALGIRLLRGRTFGAQDHATAPRVAMVNASAARRMWGDADPVGRVLRLGDAAAPPVTIVGVVADARFRDLTTALDASEPDVYLPLAQRAASNLELAVRSTLPAEALTAALRREVAAIDPQLALFAIDPLDALLARQTASSRLASTVLGAFGATALLLATVGLYGVLAFMVGQRRREIGIRLALGATRRHVVSGIVGKGVALVVSGLAFGALVALAAGRAVQSQLFGVGASDPVVFGTVVLVLFGASVLASWIPARRATRIDPQIALRAE
jgi:putative ABC transport system permease protein